MKGELRLIPKGTRIWSIKNQSNFITFDEEICEINNSVIGSDYVYVTPKQYMPFINSLKDKGGDEWGLNYSNTKEYIKPEPLIFIDKKV